MNAVCGNNWCLLCESYKTQIGGTCGYHFALKGYRNFQRIRYIWWWKWRLLHLIVCYGLCWMSSFGMLIRVYIATVCTWDTICLTSLMSVSVLWCKCAWNSRDVGKITSSSTRC